MPGSREEYYGHALGQEHLHTCPGGNEIYNLIRPFLGHHHYTLRMANHAHEYREDSLRNTLILQFLSKNYVPLE